MHRCFVRLALLAALVAGLPLAPAGAQCSSLASLGSAYTQSFDTLANAGTSSTVPAGWAFSEALANANTTYTAGTGSSNTGDTYSFGAAASGERAFGGLQSTNLNPTIGACFTNNTGVTVSNLAIAFTGEQWRVGTLGRVDRLDFEYSLDATSLTTGTWSAVDALDFIGPDQAGSTGARDGNNASFRTLVSSSISPLSIANGASFWIRWRDHNATSSDDGLAVDDFSLTPTVLDPAPTVLSTSPPDGGFFGPLGANLGITFSEPVNVAGSWFLIDCPSADFDPASANVTGGPSTFTIDPDSSLPEGEVCTATVFAAQVTDQDGNDTPPSGDAMTANHVWTFDTTQPPLLVVNEIDYDQPGGDSGEFLEIRNNGAAPVSLDPVVVELVNGNLGGAAVYQPIDLPNVTLGAGDYYVVCASNTVTPNCDLDVSPNSNLIQNGAPDAVALRWNGLLADSVSYEGDTGAPYTEGSGGGLVDAGSDDFAGISRFPDGTDSGANNGDLSLRCSTPGYANVATTPPCGAPSILGLAVSDVTAAEGQVGTRTFTFTISLDQPAGPGGVSFEVSTADGTAQDGVPGGDDDDYVPVGATPRSIPQGQTSTTFEVTVNSDTTIEPDETFFVNVANVVGASVGDPQGVGTIQNDDFATITPIHDVQGSGATSPLPSGTVVTVQGIVTGVKSSGFFLQEEPLDYDANGATSEGIFVFTSTAPPAAAQVGNLVWVTGEVSEFVPSQDLLQPPLTELTFAATVLAATGLALPPAVPLTPTLPDPAGVHDQLERLEGMRVAVSSLTVTGPTLGSTDEAQATATSTGVFFGVLTGHPRPFREPGIQDPDPPPAGSIPPIPRFDGNPEVLRVDSDALGGPALDVGLGALVTGLVGPLDYGFRRYTLLPDPPPAALPAASGGPSATAVTPPHGREVTVAAYNLERLFDTVDAPGISEPVLTAAAFDRRLQKASLGIRDHLRTPDIIGVVEVENLAALSALAARISSDALAAAQPDPQYSAHLVEGNDLGGIDVGFLVKTAPVAGVTPRVGVNAVVQENAGELFTNPDSTSELLNDRPSLRLDAVVHAANGASLPLTVIVSHLRSLNGVSSIEPGSDGWATVGDRVRAKRLKQAESLANLVQARQAADASENIVLLGDFNAFDFNDGLVDSMNLIAGAPAPDDQTAVPGDGLDLVDPDLDNLFDTAPAAERYSFVFDGNAQSLDHVLVNGALLGATVAQRLEHPRINADFPAVDRNDASHARRLSDHDPVVAYFEIASFASADLAIGKVEGADPVVAGTPLSYGITVVNGGPDPAETVAWSDPLPAGTTFVSLAAPAGWSCTTPVVGDPGSVDCAIPSLGVGEAAFTLTVQVAADAAGATLSNIATVSSKTSDPDGSDLSATESTTVVGAADLSVVKGDGSDPVTAGSELVYTLTVSNAGPSNAASVTLEDTLPAGTTFVALLSPAGWSCTTPAVGAGGTVSCTIASLAVGEDAVFTLTVEVAAGAAGTVLSNTATVSSATADPDSADLSATESTTVVGAADLSVAKGDGPDPVTAGSELVYTLTVSNGGPSDAASVSLTDTLPAGTTFVALLSPAGWSCNTPAVGAGGTVSCTIATLGLGDALFTLTVQAAADTAGTVLSNTATVSSSTADPDRDDSDLTATESTTIVGSADLSVSKGDAPDPVTAGGELVYTLTVSNAGPSNAASVTLEDPLPAGTTFVSLVSPAGWSCNTPAVGAGGTVSCTIASLAPGSAPFTLAVTVGAGIADGAVLDNTATVSSTTSDPDPDALDLTATASTAVGAAADLSVSKTDAPDPVTAGTDLVYTLTVSNGGPSDATAVALADTLPAGTSFVSLVAPAGWSCSTPAVGAGGDLSCSISTLPPGDAVLTLTVQVASGTGSGTLVTNTATVSSSTADPNPGDESGSAGTTVGAGSADYSLQKSDAPDPVQAGSHLTYTLTATNAGPSDVAAATVSDQLPAGTTFVSLTAPAGWSCVTPAMGAAGTIDCSIASLAVGDAELTLVVQVDALVAGSTVLANTATLASTTTDTVPGDTSATSTTTVVSPASVNGTKTASGKLVHGGTVTYTVVLTNAGPAAQGDNPGPELTDVLPAGLTLLGATATSGTASADLATNTVTWDGFLLAGGSVTLTITATIEAPIGATIVNQATIFYDADGFTSNEATATTDDPAAAGADDPTSFVVGAGSILEIPTLDRWTAAGLVALLGLLGAGWLRRR